VDDDDDDQHYSEADPFGVHGREVEIQGEKWFVYSSNAARIRDEPEAEIEGYERIAQIDSTYYVGANGPGGGTVFFDAGTRHEWGRFLEVAAEGWAGTSEDPTSPWSDRADTDVYDSCNAAVGSGLENTYAILRNSSESAAARAAEYSGGGYTDWYLPSQEELFALYEQSRLVYGLSAGSYWSSTQQDAYRAVSQDFTDGVQGRYNAKMSRHHLRPIRRF